jgi:integrase
MNLETTYTEIENTINSIKNTRKDEYYILYFYLKTGIRLSECNKIDEFIFLSTNIIIIDSSKYSEKRIFSKTDFEEISLVEYIDMFYFLINTTPSKVKTIMKKYIKKIKFDDYFYHCKTHIFRYLYVHKLKKAGYTIEDVQNKLGHKNIASTEVYYNKLNV